VLSNRRNSASPPGIRLSAVLLAGGRGDGAVEQFEPVPRRGPRDTGIGGLPAMGMVIGNSSPGRFPVLLSEDPDISGAEPGRGRLGYDDAW
jgi:hypothetical protein